MQDLSWLQYGRIEILKAPLRWLKPKILHLMKLKRGFYFLLSQKFCKHLIISNCCYFYVMFFFIVLFHVIFLASAWVSQTHECFIAFRFSSFLHKDIFSLSDYQTVWFSFFLPSFFRSGRGLVRVWTQIQDFNTRLYFADFWMGTQWFI